VADATVVVDFIANTKGLQKGAAEASSSTSKFGSKLKSLGKAAALGAGAAGVGALVATLKIGVDEYMQASKVAAQTNTVIKSTGGAARVSAAHVSDLATAIMEKSGMDDEAIASGENLLLTFTNIRNEAGKGNDIFDQTTSLMADMSVALGQDTASSAMQLGKALNDPVKGMTALQRVGVSFTKAQKDQVKAMVESGDTMGAQKLILAELNKEFGGSAEAAGKTLPGQLAIARESFNNFAGELVAKMIPAIQSVIAWVRDHWPEISRVLQAAWAVIQPLLAAFGALVVQIVSLIAAHWSQIKPIVMAVVPVLRAAVGVIVSLVKLVTAILRGDWSAAWTQAKNLVGNVVKLITALLRFEVTIWKTVLSLAWSAIKAGASAAWSGIKSAVGSAVDWISNKLEAIPRALRSILGAVERAASSVANAIRNPLNHLISSWNGLAFRIPSIHIPQFDTKLPGVGKIGGGSFGGQTVPFPDLPHLAAGGVLTRPTLFLGGEAGREIVSPESLLRSILREEGAGATYQLNLTTQRADAADVAWGFRRLELLRTGR
jgi:hypothetical protein